MIYWPEPIYRALPWIYLIAGFLTAYNFKSGLGFFSSSLLFAACGLVLKMRYEHRRYK